MKIIWYFDFLSPFAYLQHELLLRNYPKVQRIYRPVLLAGLLRHWANKGPAEIPSKRTAMYHYCHWFAAKNNVRLRFPPTHPFNPLPPLRLTIARGCRENDVTKIFRAIFADGADVGEDKDWTTMCKQIGADDAAGLIAQQAVKDELRTNTDTAITTGVFGVPTLIIGDRLFWGADMTTMAMEYVAKPKQFDDDEYQRLATLPVGAVRGTV